MARYDVITGMWAAVIYDPAEHGDDVDLAIESGYLFSSEADACAAETFAMDLDRRYSTDEFVYELEALAAKLRNHHR